MFDELSEAIIPQQMQAWCRNSTCQGGVKMSLRVLTEFRGRKRITRRGLGTVIILCNITRP